MLTTDTFIDAV